MTVAMDIAGLQLGVVTLLCPILLAFVIYFLVVTGRPGPLPVRKANQCNRSKRLPKGWQVKPVVAPASVEGEEAPEDLGDEDAVEEEAPVNEELVEEEQEEVVVKQEPPPAARPSSKSGKKKQKAEVVEEPAPVEEEAVPEEAAPEEEDAPDEVMVEEAAVDEEVPPEEEAPEEAADEAPVEETAAAPAEEAPQSQPETTGKKKRKGKKPKAAFLAAQQFRMGQEAVEEPPAVEDDFDAREWEILMKDGDDGDWATAGAATKAKKEKKRAAEVEVVVPEEDVQEEAVAVEEAVVEPAAVDEGVDEGAGEEADGDAGEETVEAEAGEVAEDEDVGEVVEEAGEEEAEHDEQEEVAATQDKEDEEEEEEEEAGEEEEEAAAAVGVDDDWEGEAVKADEEEPDADEPEDDNAQTQMDIDVPHEKRGLVIGKNKKTLQLIEDSCGLTQRIAQVGGTFTVKGTGKACKQAVEAITQIVEKGYTSLQYDNFTESSFEVSATSRPNIIGMKGAVINTIKEKCSQVIIDVPPLGAARGGNAKLLVTVAGSEADVEAASQIIQQIDEFGYSEITHPDMTHIRIPVDSYQKGAIIGKSGSQIKQLKESCNVQVKILDKEGQAQVSGAKVAVKKAKAQIEKILKDAESWIANAKAKDAEAERKREEEAAARAAAEAEAELEQANAAAASAEEAAENDEGEAVAENDEEEGAEEAAEEAEEAEDGEEQDEEEDDADA